MIPVGPGNTDAQFELIEAYRPVGYSGTPDFLKILLDAAASAGRDVSSIKRAMVSGIPNWGRLRLVVTRADENDTMSLKAACAAPSDALRQQIVATLRAVAKLGGQVELVAAGTLPNDGKVIADER